MKSGYGTLLLYDNVVGTELVTIQVEDGEVAVTVTNCYPHRRPRALGIHLANNRTGLIARCSRLTASIQVTARVWSMPLAPLRSRVGGSVNVRVRGFLEGSDTDPDRARARVLLPAHTGCGRYKAYRHHCSPQQGWTQQQQHRYTVLMVPRRADALGGSSPDHRQCPAKFEGLIIATRMTTPQCQNMFTFISSFTDHRN